MSCGRPIFGGRVSLESLRREPASIIAHTQEPIQPTTPARPPTLPITAQAHVAISTITPTDVSQEHPYVLSVLVCTIPSRVSNFLPNIIKQLDTQAKGKPVQILYLGDNRKMTVGKKRNLLMSMAEGKYLCFVDDDDMLAADYIDSLLEAAKSDADCLLFDVPVSLNGSYPKLTKFSIHHVNTDYPMHYERKPAHITATKTCHARAVKFPEISAGEDYAWQAQVIPLLKTEHQIGKSLYYYNWNYVTSSTVGLDIA